jgi:hypothetical protein
MQYLIDRIKEPSTWAGLSVVLAMLGISVGEQELAIIGSGIGALLAIVMREKGKA